MTSEWFKIIKSLKCCIELESINSNSKVFISFVSHRFARKEFGLFRLEWTLSYVDNYIRNHDAFKFVSYAITRKLMKIMNVCVNVLYEDDNNFDDLFLWKFLFFDIFDYNYSIIQFDQFLSFQDAVTLPGSLYAVLCQGMFPVQFNVSSTFKRNFNCERKRKRLLTNSKTKTNNCSMIIKGNYKVEIYDTTSNHGETVKHETRFTEFTNI